MKLWDKIRYGLLVGLCWLVGLLPEWFLYHCLLDFIYFILYRVLRYRVKVVRTNLGKSFPEKSREELRSIEKGFYYHLAEIFVDTIDLVGITRKQLDRRISFGDMEAHEAEVAGRNWIAALAHYGSWEYFMAYQLHTSFQVIGVFHRLHDKAFDKFYNRSRSRFGLEPVSMKSTMRYIVRHRDDERKMAVGLIADQNAPVRKDTLWFEFLNHKTPFFEGIERFALMFKMPVYYLRVTKKGRARYTASFEKLYDGEEAVYEGEITQRYVTALENSIKAEPRYWMWSHRRWKFTYEGQRVGVQKPAGAEDNEPT